MENRRTTSLGGTPGEQQETSVRNPSYHVVEEDFDTRIHECDGSHGDVGEYATWVEARDAAVKYLREMIAGCQSALEGIEPAETYREYAKNPLPSVPDPRGASTETAPGPP